ncbi:DUF5658 family protein [Halogranum amylolyticum]|uniref:DUF5658 family protein n=1 Tax=Halogranum amylolyticum TaxID=660520 RepID=UPI001FCCF85B|nr:DUF5658 family protein [Halogranum amylolyticum]
MATPSRSGVDPTSTGTVETCIARGARRATRYEAALWTLALLTLALDVVTTTYGLRLGLAEMNPLVNALLPTFGLFGTFSVLKGSALLVGVTAWWLMPSAFRGVVPLGLSLPWAVAGVSNTALLVTLHL